MDEPSLRDIEHALTLLWTRRDERQLFLSGQSNISPALLKQIDHRGVKLYASLIDLGRLDLMASIYPLCKKILGKHFSTLVHEYMETMPPEHFNLNQSARKFSQFLASYAEPHLKRHPFLAELADYEWIELAVLEADVLVESNSEASDQSILNSNSSEELDLKAFAASVPCLNQTVITRAYKYPISEIAHLLEAGGKLPRRQKAQPSWLLAYRAVDHNCHYLDVSELTFEIVEMAAKRDSSYGELIALACSESSNIEETVADFLSMVEEFKSLGVIL